MKLTNNPRLAYIKKAYHTLPFSSSTKERLKSFIFTVFKPFLKNTQSYINWQVWTKDNRIATRLYRKGDSGRLALNNYIAQILALPYKGKDNPDYVQKHGTAYRPQAGDVKHIAFYLPQYHPIAENDEWWGKGFMEWTNVTKAVPLFPGHNQPRLPGELGYYDLRYKETIKQQMELARFHGVYGFCIYYYWFGGKTLLETPLKLILENPELDLPFCLCWANENWTRRWDGMNNDVLISQDYEDGFAGSFIRDVAAYMSDPRYIKINGKPVLAVYHCTKIPKMKDVLTVWREHCIKSGIGEITILAVDRCDISLDYASTDIGFDGFIEFPPHGMMEGEYGVSPINHEIEFICPHFDGKIYDYMQLVKDKQYLSMKHPQLYKGITLAWDNTARTRWGRESSVVLHRFSLSAFREWLEDLHKYTKENFEEGNRFIFINAWNEWAEGTYLEPDREYGYGVLDCIRSVLSDNRISLER